MLGNEDGQLCPGQQDTNRGNVPGKTNLKQIKKISKRLTCELFAFCII
jgi:hypothetical protein